ncbi:MAG: hypothetical protein GY711_24115 [bacterium]|nr:hypothetical protein [bacterium]
MPRPATIATIAILLAGCALLVVAGERHVSAADTSEALELIDSGLDWDGATPISIVQQTDRMNANVAVLRDQKSARNLRGGLGLLLVGAGAFALFRQRARTRPGTA